MGKKAKKSRKLSVYSNLIKPKKAKKSKKSSKLVMQSQYLASLPKFSWKRISFHLNPKHLADYWFSKHGAIQALKIFGVMM